MFPLFSNEKKKIQKYQRTVSNCQTADAVARTSSEGDRDVDWGTCYWINK